MTADAGVGPQSQQVRQAPAEALVKQRAKVVVLTSR